MDFKETTIPGCYEISPSTFRDDRGIFVKTFHERLFAERGLEISFRESYYSVSKKGVLRGLHLQLPPVDHVKLVYCTAGEVLDVVLDLRIGSPSFGKFSLLNLSSEKGNIAYIPKGLAHGFYVKSNSATMVYNTSTVYSPDHDSGILWSSAGIPWPSDEPNLSERDSMFMPLDKFMSPFRYKQGEVL